MKKTLFVLLILAFLSTTVYAGQSGQGHGQGKPGGGKGQRMAQMQENLGLSDEQVEQMRSIRENGGGRDEMRAVLTDEQRAKMDEYRAMRQGQGRGDGTRGGKGNRPPGNASQTDAGSGSTSEDDSQG